MENVREIVAMELCDECGGAGFLFYGNDEEYSVEACSCVPADEDFLEMILGA